MLSESKREKHMSKLSMQGFCGGYRDIMKGRGLSNLALTHAGAHQNTVQRFVWHQETTKFYVARRGLRGNPVGVENAQCRDPSVSGVQKNH